MKQRPTKVGILSCIVLASFLAAGCSSRVGDEEMRKLDELKQENAALQREVAQKEEQKAALDREIAAKNEKLKKCNDDKQVVQARLGK